MARHHRRRLISSKKPRSIPILFNVIFLTALLIGILIFKHVIGDRAAEMVDQFGTEGTGEAALDDSHLPVAVGVAGSLVLRSVVAAETMAAGPSPEPRPPIPDPPRAE